MTQTNPYEQNPGCDIDAVQIINIGMEPQLSFDPHYYDAGVLTQNDTDATQFQIWNSGFLVLNYTLFEMYIILYQL